MTNLVAENLSYQSPRERETFKIGLKYLQALGTYSANDFKVTIRMNLTGDNEVTTEDVELAEKTFRPDIGELKGKVKRSRPLPIQSQAIDMSRGLLSLH